MGYELSMVKTFTESPFLQYHILHSIICQSDVYMAESKLTPFKGINLPCRCDVNIHGAPNPIELASRHDEITAILLTDQ